MARERTAEELAEDLAEAKAALADLRRQVDQTFMRRDVYEANRAAEQDVHRALWKAVTDLVEDGATMKESQRRWIMLTVGSIIMPLLLVAITIIATGLSR